MLVLREMSDASPTASPLVDKPHRSLSRLYLGGSQSKRSASRTVPPPIIDAPQPSPPAPQPQNRSPEKEKVLRKRSTSGPEVVRPLTAHVPKGPGHPNAPGALTPSIAPALLPGATALEQIGDGDHSGWMRKKGERYNAWRLRYFVLKGPHLYYVKSLTVSALPLLN